MRWIVSFLMVLGLVSCGVTTSNNKNAPKRAIIYQDNQYGMHYHIKIFIPEADRREQYVYIPMHFYTNSIETQYADEVIWRTYSDDEVPFEEGGEQLSQVLIVFDDKQIVLSGFVDMYRGLNGSYQIETTSPESWGISVIE